MWIEFPAAPLCGSCVIVIILHQHVDDFRCASLAPRPLWNSGAAVRLCGDQLPGPRIARCQFAEARAGSCAVTDGRRCVALGVLLDLLPGAGALRAAARPPAGASDVRGVSARLVGGDSAARPGWRTTLATGIASVAGSCRGALLPRQQHHSRPVVSESRAGP